jgi:hypothetical protein
LDSSARRVLARNAIRPGVGQLQTARAAFTHAFSREILRLFLWSCNPVLQP